MSWLTSRAEGTIAPGGSPRSQSRKEMWLTGEKYDWLHGDLSQYDWRRRRLVTLVPEFFLGILPVIKRESQQWVKTLEHM